MDENDGVVGDGHLLNLGLGNGLLYNPNGKASVLPERHL
jgi:hypothetical protein